MIKIVADQDIPFVEHYFAQAGELSLFTARHLSKAMLVNADLLLVRSVTAVNKELLANTAIQCVGSPTTGFDHLDIAWLNQAGIQWVNAPGCNAKAVEEYLVCVLAALQKNGYLQGSGLRAGVIGVGTIGRLVVKRLEQLGFVVVQCDPYRADVESCFPHCAFDSLRDLDLITIHAPLTYTGKYPTFHAIQRDFLAQQKKNTVLINTSRGAIINSEDLKRYGQTLVWCLDVWENEPCIDFEILNSALLATPHIAGYTVQSRHRGTAMLYHALVKKGVIPGHEDQGLVFPWQIPKVLPSAIETMSGNWRDYVLRAYNPWTSSEIMKKAMLNDYPYAFEHLRRNFKDRHEFEFIEFS